MPKMPTYRNLVEVGEEKVKIKLEDLPQEERKCLAENRARNFFGRLGYKEIKTEK